MTEPQSLTRDLSTLARRVGWFAVACAAASLALTIAARLSGGRLRWTAWALPILLVANSSVLFLGGLNRWPRLARPFVVVSLAVAILILVSEMLVLLHR